jgi:hypothetical protein
MDILKAYKSFQRHNSIFIPKRKIVFMIEPGKFIFAEFYEASNIYSVKKYIEKFLDKRKFDLVYNGNILPNNLYIGDLCYDNPNLKRLFFKVKVWKNKIIERYKKDINIIEENNRNLNNELNKLKKEIDTKEYSNQITEEKYKNINNIYLKQKDEINELKQKLKQINDDINIITNHRKNRNRNYSMENIDNFELKTYNNIFTKSDSIIYSIKGRNRHSRNLANIKSQ